MLVAAFVTDKNVSTLPSVLWEAKSALVENHWSDLRTSQRSSAVVEGEVSEMSLSPAVSGLRVPDTLPNPPWA